MLIIYCEQLSEGYEDQRRYQIMYQVGLTRPEAEGAIRSQILLVFCAGYALVYLLTARIYARVAEQRALA